nr:hypothetical protein [Shewanella ferrihydritica]
IGMDFNDARSKSQILHVFPFNSEKKHGEDTSSVTDAASRSVDPDSLVKMNATAEALEAKEKVGHTP